MNAASQASRSLWMALSDLPQASRTLPDDLPETLDIVVVGAGIAGLSAAYELAVEGRGVCVLDRGPIAGGMTARTTAHLSSQIDDTYAALIDVRGEKEARLYHASQLAAIDRVEAIQQREAIACDFARIDGWLCAATADHRDILEREHAACARLGVACDWAEMPLPGAGERRALRFARQARFQPLAYCAGLADAIRRHGGHIVADCAVLSLDEDDAEVAVKLVNGRTLRSTAVIAATNAPISNRVGVHTKQAPYRTYAVAGRVRRGSVADALYWDTAEPYHYIRLQPADDNHDWLIVGGEDHKTGTRNDGAERLARLAAWAARLAPFTAEHRWSGQVLEPVDYLPFAGLGPGHRRIWLTSGDSGQGMTNSVAAAMLIRDLVLGRPNDWATCLDPGRISTRTLGTYVEENLTAVKSLAEHLGAGDIASFDALAPGAGGTLRHGLRKLAVSRDEAGTLHACSATCTHVGCQVEWNSFERCWDCPCHGSQFAPDGEVLNAPALSGLEVVPEAELRRRG